MAPIQRLLLLALLSTALTISSGFSTCLLLSGDGYTMNGRVKIPQASRLSSLLNGELISSIAMHLFMKPYLVETI
ncbi:hypothetical protein V6N13_051625 [Hibiscus sabdariffa]|uniref:Uncharacterized protein n=1 Tax=Hibiscus sabdariffa TaxID=183260 RepID=A0ABR2T4S7_9ROSI